MTGVYRIAERTVEIRSLYPYVHELCDAYRADGGNEAPDIVLETGPAVIAFERSRAAKRPAGRFAAAFASRGQKAGRVSLRETEAKARSRGIRSGGGVSITPASRSAGPRFQILSLRPKHKADSVSCPPYVLFGVRRDAGPLTRRSRGIRSCAALSDASAEHCARPRFQILSLRPRKVPETLCFRGFFCLLQRRQKSGLTTGLTRDRIISGF